MNLSLKKIRIDCGTQARAEMSEATIDEYVEKLINGVIFPPVRVYFDGIDYYLTDGFHRYFANLKAGSPNIDCTIIEGTLREAIIDSLGANGMHGKQRTAADKRKSVFTMLNDLEWESWSDREIAKKCNVSHSFVSALRKEIGEPKEVTKYQRDGKEITMERQIKPPKEKPELLKEHLETFTDDEKETLFEAVDLLKAENQALTDKLAVVSVSPEAAERDMAQSLIAELRAQIKLLEIELKAMTQSRDTYQSEKAQLMKQNAALQNKLKKYESGK